MEEMKSPNEDFKNTLIELDTSWSQLNLLQDLNYAEVAELVQKTLSNLILDFRFLNQESISDLMINFQKTLTSIQFPVGDMKDMVEAMSDVKRWDTPVATALLSGKLFPRSSTKLIPCEEHLLGEEDNVIQARLVSLLTFFEICNSEESGQMILNGLETYKSFLISEKDFQNKVSFQTLELLVKASLIIFCHRKEFDHLNSMIKVLPHHRKIQFIIQQTNSAVPGKDERIKTKQCNLFICSAILQDLLQSELKKSRQRQSISMFNLYLNLIVALARQEDYVDRQLEKLFLSACDMEVISEYYYLAANVLREKMPNRHEDFVIKLISIGLSHDLSYLEHVKYTKDSPDSTEIVFIKTHKKIFKALIVLGCIIKDYGIRRLCIQAAMSCETQTDFAKQILSKLPQHNTSNFETTTKMTETLNELREQLETFQSAIKKNVELSGNWTKSSINCYEDLIHLNRKAVLSEDLVPLVYPGVEKNLKRNRSESTEEAADAPKKDFDASQFMNENANFRQSISDRLKQMRHPFKPCEFVNFVIPSEIKAVMIQILAASADFEIGCGGEVFMKLATEEVLNADEKWRQINDEQRTSNKPNLLFDFTMNNEESTRNCDLSVMYQEGHVRVHNLSANGFNFFDICNVMVYAIMEKKALYMKQEFIELNQNQNVTATSPAQSAFWYVSCRGAPEYGRTMRILTLGILNDSVLEYFVETFNFFVDKGKYRFVNKYSTRSATSSLLDDSTAGSGLDDTQKMEQPKAEKEVKRKPPKTKLVKDLIKSSKPPKDLLKPPKESFRSPKEQSSVVQPKVKKETKPLSPQETFQASQEILSIFKNIEEGLAVILNAPVSFDLKQMCDESSPHKVAITFNTPNDKYFPLNFSKRRNLQCGHGQANSRQISTLLSLPARLHGYISVLVEHMDAIVYDENLENPTVKSSGRLTVSGNIGIDHCSHNIKNMDMECSGEGFKACIKVTLRNGSRSRPRSSLTDSPSTPITETNSTNSISSVGSNQSQGTPKKQSEELQKFVADFITNAVKENSQPVDDSFQSQESSKEEPVDSSQVNGHSQNESENYQSYQQTAQPAQENGPESFEMQSNEQESFKYSPVREPNLSHESFKHSPVLERYSMNGTPVQVVTPMIANNMPSNLPHPTMIKNSPEFINNNFYSEDDGGIQVTSPPSSEYSHFANHVQYSPCKDEPTQYNEPYFQEESPVVVNPIPIEDCERKPVIQPSLNVPSPMKSSPNLENVKILKVEDVPPLGKFVIKTEPVESNYREPLVEMMKNNIKVKVEVPLDMEIIDFEDQIATSVVKAAPLLPSMMRPIVEDPTPPTSPPPLYHPQSETEKMLSYDDIKREPPLDYPANRILNNTPPEDTHGVIDLTDDVVDLTHENRQRFYPDTYNNRRFTLSQDPLTFTYQMPKPSDMLTSQLDMGQGDLKHEFTRVMKKFNYTKNCRAPAPKFKSTMPVGKRFRSFRELAQDMKKGVKVGLVDVLKNINRDALKRNMNVQADTYKIKLPTNESFHRPSHRDYVLKSSEEELPFEDPLDFVTDFRETTFHILFQSTVSYAIDDQSGDGFANELLTANNHMCNADLKCRLKSLKNILNNTNVNVRSALNLSSTRCVDNYKSIANDALLKSFANVNLAKTLYSDKNCFNFTKNLKNLKKFTQWQPKTNNDSPPLDKKLDEDEKSLKSSDNQLSHEILKSVPGLNSFEFFKLSSTPQRTVQVIHVFKDMKNGNSLTTSDISDNEHHQEVNSSQSESINGDSGTSTHVQRIGQTSINREVDPKTVQTSFGSVVKNTYPPATLSTRIANGSELSKAIEKEQQKFVKLRGEDVQIKKITSHEAKPGSNIKIVACSSSTSSQAEAQKNNRNQTLINMLTQQVMLPTNSNRHFIITSNKADVKCENNLTTVTTSLPSHQNVVKKVVTSGQSQLVQILNSPPSSFTMKSSMSPAAKSPNQIVTVAPSVSNTNFKTELPTAVKQQGIVQFICKTDGKIIHLTPICNNSAGGSQKKITYKVDTTGAKGPTILHHANQQIIINNQLKKSDNQNILTIIQKQDDSDKNNKSPMLAVSQSSSTPTSPISTRSIYEETYAKFIQTSTSSKVSDMGLLTISSSPGNGPITSTSPNSIIQKIGKTVIQSSNQVLPKFNQAFGKAVFTTNDQLKNKIIGTKEILTSRHVSVSFTETKPITKVTRTISEIKSSDAGTLLSLIENDNAEKQLPTLQSALQSNLLYARPIGNGKLIASNGNNVLLTALRGNNQQSNVRIITSIADNANRTIMAPMRISVPIQIPKLINTTRPQTPGTFRQQIVIAAAPSRMQQTMSNQSSSSKLESLLMTSQPTVVKQEVEVEQQHKQQIKVETKPKKNVDHSTLEQLREFDMVLEQVLERSSSEVTATSISSPTTPDSVRSSSPKKQISIETKTKTEVKLNAVTITSISPSVSPGPKAMCSGAAAAAAAAAAAKAVPKLQEDEHTAQRILDILANYKEQVRNSPDLNNKPAPRRRANPPTNPPAAKRKKVVVSGGSMKSSKQFGSNSDMMTDTMGSEEDSSCGMGSGVASTGSMNNSPTPQDIDDHTDVSMDNNFYMEDSKRETALSPQSSSSSVATSPSHNKFPMGRRLILTETKTSPGGDASPGKNIVITSSPSPSSSGSLGPSLERFGGQGSTAVLMPGNYLLPMNVLKGGQQLAILSSNNGQKIIAVPTNQLSSSGTSIILQRYLNQANDASNKTILSQSDSNQNAFKSVRLHQSPSVTYVSKSNSVPTSGSTLYIRPIQSVSQSEMKPFSSNQQTVMSHEEDTRDSMNSKFVSDKNLITEIIQQQQQLSHTHPQQNFMIKLNEHQPSDPRSSSSIMFVSNSSSTSTFTEAKNENPKIKIEEMDYEDYMKEDVIDLLSETDSIAKSPMLNTKLEADDNTNSNQESGIIYDDSCVKIEDDQDQKFQQFPVELNSNHHGKSMNVNNVSTSRNIKGFLIDPTNKIVMYSDRKPATLEKEFFNQKSFSEECADLGVDEPIASDLFPEADLLFDSGSPKFDQITSHDGAMHIKKELENGQVLLEMNYNHNMETESWLNFDTEEELVDDSRVMVEGVKVEGPSEAYFS